jgi:hypothetical protein
MIPTPYDELMEANKKEKNFLTYSGDIRGMSCFGSGNFRVGMAYINGGPSEDRTPDPLIKSQLLCQLS